MSRLVVRAFSVSLDGFGAGVSQSLEHPLGIGGPTLHGWFFPTRTFQKTVLGKDGGTTGPDDDIAARSMEGLGAWILGRNMFAHSRGPWTDDGWRGWWGEEPPYHVPVFVLTHHAHEPLPMQGGTTFHFVTGGIHEALARAREAAGDRDIRVGGGVSTVRQYLSERLIDEMHLAFSPVLLGRGESLFAGIDLPALGYRVSSHVHTEAAAHVTFVRE
ncbi:MAG: dihydrofolate reductase family protein [Candidatus Eisenbacteria bacterium]|uniref:Dihydrofolate reductase family protein n=1 Tax=Eiseniibacteriota bacterium TaxID=2212470 RepID=A0A933SAC7_UNCEI|nr:dihydrofolate reductase family protein [Candidatus Eisenbacteria bacterium]